MAHPPQQKLSPERAVTERIIAALSGLDLGPLTTEQVRATVERRVSEWFPADPELHVAQARDDRAARTAVLRFALAVGGVVLAFVAQSILDPGILGGMLRPLSRAAAGTPGSADGLTAAALVYVLAAALFALAVPSWTAAQTTSVLQGRASMLPRTARRGVGLRALAIAISFAVYAAEMVLFATQGETAVVRVLWIGAMVMLVLSQLPFASPGSGPHPRAERSPAFAPVHWLGLAAIVVVALVVRAYRFDTVPEYFHGDVASIGLQTRAILQGQESGLFKLGWSVHPMLAFMPTAITEFVFGDSLAGIRMSPVIMGTLMVGGLYLLVWRLFDSHRLAALSAATLALTASHIVYSHLPTPMDPWVFTVFGWFLLIDGLRARRPVSLALAGILIGMSFQLYHSGRLGAFILAAFALYLLLFRRAWLFDNVAGLIAFSLGGLYVVGPNLLVFATAGLVTRGDAFLLGNSGLMAHLRLKYRADSDAGVWLEQIRRGIGLFNYYRDESTQAGAYSAPFFTAAFSPLLVLGFGAMVRAIRHPGQALFLLTLAAGVISTIITSDPPYWFRIVMLMFVGAVGVAYALDRLCEAVRRLSIAVEVRGSGRSGARRHALWAAGLAAVLAFVFVGAAGAGDWLEFQRQSSDDANTQSLVARFAASLPTSATLCTTSDWPALAEREVQFLGYPRRGSNVAPGMVDTVTGPCAERGAVWLLNGTQTDTSARLRTRFPSGQTVEHRTSNGQLIFISFAPVP